MPRRLHPAYRRLWDSSVAELWPPEAAELVAMLVTVRDLIRRQGDEVMPSLLSQANVLARELLLTPRAARGSGVTVEPAGTVVPLRGRSRTGRDGLTPELRKQLARNRRDAALVGIDAWSAP